MDSMPQMMICAACIHRQNILRYLYIAELRSSKGKDEKPSLREAFVFLTKSKQIRCLAVMALAQGLSTNLIDIAWKSHLHMLHPSPAAYSVS